MILDKDIAENIEIFFKEETCNPGTNSSLALLRNDINRCFDSGILYPGIIGMMTGIDLLAKFYSGDDSNSDVGSKFKDFLKYYFYLSNEDEREYIYQLRNVMLHSFGLFSQNKKDGFYYFTLTQDGEFMLYNKEEEGKNVKININILELRKKFNQAIYFYKKDLFENEDILDRFKKIKIKRFLQEIS